MPDCELLLTCPFFNSMVDDTNELTAFIKKHYCHGYYARCGRYMAFKALERETEMMKTLSHWFPKANETNKGDP